MNKVIYIDFDGVLVDTPKFINEELKIIINPKDNILLESKLYLKYRSLKSNTNFAEKLKESRKLEY